MSDNNEIDDFDDTELSEEETNHYEIDPFETYKTYRQLRVDNYRMSNKLSTRINSKVDKRIGIDFSQTVAQELHKQGIIHKHSVQPVVKISKNIDRKVVESELHKQRIVNEDSVQPSMNKGENLLIMERKEKN